MLKSLDLSKRLFLKEVPELKDPLWVHVSSVGEFNTFLPILKDLKKRHKILITYFSPRAKEFLEGKKEYYDAFYPLPLDVPFIIRKFEEKVKPKALLILERELWFSLIRFTKTKKALLNAYAKGNLRERFLCRYFDLIIARTKKDKEVFERLGAKKVKVCGNLKFVYENEEKELNLSLNGNTIVVGSTHKGEEEIILRAFKRLKSELKNLKLILAPRHINRVQEVKKISESMGFRTLLYSNNGSDFDVLVVDRLGILKDLYKYGKVAVVGGTFVNVGGHNILEPAYWGIPVVYGKYTQKVEDLRNFLENEGLGFKAEDENYLYELLRNLIKNPVKRSSNLKEYGEKIKKCYIKEIENFLG